METKNKSIQPIIYAIILVAGMLVGRFVNQGNAPSNSNSGKINQVLKLVQNQYVDTLDANELQEEVIQKVLSTLDPHSYYIKAEDVEQVNRDLVGSFVGIGIEFNVINDTPYIVRVMNNGPAQIAGVRPADRLITANDSNLIGLSNMEIVRVLKGEKNSEVQLSVLRPSSTELQEILIKRNTVPIPSVSAAIRMNDSTGYIKVDRFASKTNEEFEQAIRNIQKDGKIDQLIVDLRNNPGGYLHIAIDMLDQFFDERLLLAYTKGKSSYKKDYYSSKGGVATDMKLVCLVNRNSASASEIFSGAIQDYDRGLVLGEKTFGKGLVQETFELPDKSQLRLTVSRYYIPSGRCIQKAYVDGIQSYYDEVNHRKDTTIEHTDSFYYETKNGRKVFGGGGIDPDINFSKEKFHNAWLFSRSFNQSLIKLIDLEYNTIIEQKNSEQLEAEVSFLNEINKLIPKDSGISSNEYLLPIVRRFYGDEAYFIELTKKDSLIIEAEQSFKKISKLLKLN